MKFTREDCIDPRNFQVAVPLPALRDFSNGGDGTFIEISSTLFLNRKKKSCFCKLGKLGDGEWLLGMVGKMKFMGRKSRGAIRCRRL